MSTLYTDNIRANNASQITLPTGQKIVGTDSGSFVAPGNVIQTVSYNIDQGTTTFAGSTSLSLTSGQTLIIGAGTITPKYSTSKILVMGHNVFHQSGSGYVYLRIMRDSTIVQTPGNAIGYQQPNGGRIEIPYFHFDSPGTTSAITYSHRIDYHGGTIQMIANYGSCNLTLMEIAQ